MLVNAAVLRVYCHAARMYSATCESLALPRCNEHDTTTHLAAMLRECCHPREHDSTTHLTAVLRECRHVGCILLYMRVSSSHAVGSLVSQAVEVSSCRAAIHEKLAISGARCVSE
ncbi:hypothetical protein BDZ91DRAFT_752931 [Kalaharituber pfeilii]|nr:hypothetical protein BDZ91DRAFT_752931 [Kalaharituber pfeilii]